MATYTPNNTFVFVAAFTGCQAGILGRVSQTNSDTEETYAPTDLIAGAWAQAIDTAWGVSTNPDLFQYSGIEDLSEVYWLSKNSLPSPADIQRISYTIPASKILLMLLSGKNYLSSQSITPPPFPPGGGNSGVIWRPGVPSVGPAVETEAEIIAAVNAADGFITVAIDSSTAPAVLTGILNGRGALTLTAYNATLGAGPGFVSDILTIADGGQIQRLQTVGNFLGIACDCKTLASLTFGNGDCLTVNAGAIYLTSDATTFAVQVPTGETLQLTVLNDSIIGAADTDTLIKLAGTATLILLMLSDSLIDGDAVNGDGGSTLTYSHDDTVPLVTFGAMSGTASEVRLSQARWASPASGTTGQRPTGASLNVGQLYFDTTLNTVIAWNGATWVILGTSTATGTVTAVTGSAPIVITSTPTTTPNVTIVAATDSVPGSMSAADKTKLDGITTTVSAVFGTAPIVSSGGLTPAISIVAATDSVPGSMSAADKTKLDGITTTVSAVSGTAPIVSSGGLTPAISIVAATDSVPGSMSAADKTKLDGITTTVSAVSGTAPIVSSGGLTPAISLAASGVAAATYGDSTHVSQVTVDALGRVTAAANVAIAAGGSGTVTTVTGSAPIVITSTPTTTPNVTIVAATDSVPGSMSAADKTKLDGITTTVSAVSGTAPIVSSGGLTPAISLAASGVAAATYGDSTHVSQVTVDALGRVTAAANVAIAAGGSGTVTTVTGSAPIVITSTPTTTPNVTIVAATDSVPGSMSAADKTKLDGITTTVSAVSGTAPIVSSGGLTPAISIVAATDSVPGSMSAADKTKLDGITAGAAPQTPWTSDIDGANHLLKNAQTVTFDQEVANGATGTAQTITWGSGQKQTSTLTGNCTFTFTAPPGVGNFLLRLVQDATGSRTASWPASVKWVGSAAPTLTPTANGVDIISLYYNGTNYYGSAGLNFG